jgi:type II secretory pathway component PulF
MNKTIKTIKRRIAQMAKNFSDGILTKSKSLKTFFENGVSVTFPKINSGIRWNLFKLNLGRFWKAQPLVDPKTGKDRGRKKSIGGFFPGMSTQEQIIFIKRLAILVKSGVSIVLALDMLQRQSSARESRKIIADLRDCVEVGQSLAKAMGNYGKVFGKFAVSIVQIGEMSGTLTQNLDYLADDLKKKQELKRNIVGALIYPAFILVATIGIVVLLTAYVFPKILPVFQSFRTSLPWSTRTLIAVSLFMQHYWMYLLGGLAVLAVLIGTLRKNPAIKLCFDRVALRAPLIGPMFKRYHITNFSRTLGLLLKSDIGIIQALRITGETSGNGAYRAAFSWIIDRVARGESISQNMEKNKFLFPPLVSQMVGVGEMTGNLSSSLMYLAEIYEDEMNNSTKNLSTSIEPVLMIFMGVLVGFIAISIITPIYGITQSLH